MTMTDHVQNIAAATNAAPVQERPRRAVENTDAKTRARLDEILRQLRESMGSGGTQVSFSVNEDAGRVVVRVTDADTGELIRQIPSEDVLRIAKNIRSVLGLLYDTMA